MKRWLLITLAALVVMYGAACAWVYWLMHQPPVEFARGFARLPAMSLAALPFEPMWKSARHGWLQVGDRAPTVQLPVLDRSTTVRIGGGSGRPVLLVFGSYT